MVVGKALLLVLVAEKVRSSSGADWATPAGCPLGFDDCNAKCDTDFPLEEDDTYDFSYGGSSYGYGSAGAYFYFGYDISAGDMEVANEECKAQCAAKCPLPPPPLSPPSSPPAAPVLAKTCANKLKFGDSFWRVAPVWNKGYTRPCQGGRCCKLAEGITEDTCNLAIGPEMDDRRQRSLLFAKVPKDDGLDDLLDINTEGELENVDGGEATGFFLCYWDGGKCKGKFVNENQAQSAACMEVVGKVMTSYS